MITDKIDETTFHFDGDMQGDVIIQGTNGGKVRLPGPVLMKFVLNRLREQKIGSLESMNIEDLKINIIKSL